MELLCQRADVLPGGDGRALIDIDSLLRPVYGQANQGQSQLSPQIKKIQVTERKAGKTVVRYQITADADSNPESGRRQ